MFILWMRMGMPFARVSLPSQNPRLLKLLRFLSFTLFYVILNQAYKIL